MDIFTFVLQAIQIIPRFLPKSRPPTVNYLSLMDKMPGAPVAVAPQASYPIMLAPPVPAPAPQPVLIAPATPTEEHEPEAEGTQKTGCIPCSRSHLSTVSGALGESLRFAREEGGVMHPEVQRRIMLAEDASAGTPGPERWHRRPPSPGFLTW